MSLSAPLLDTTENYSTGLVNLLLEAQARAQQISTTQTLPSENAPFNDVPAEIIQVGKHINHIVLVDLASSTLFLFDTTTSIPTLIKQHYISSGETGFGKLNEGDLKSPARLP